MLNTHTCDLLSAAEDALRPPSHIDPHQLGRWHAHTLRHRLPLVREALRVAHEDGDVETATHLIDQAVSDHPATPSRVEMARTWARHQLGLSGNPRGQHPFLVWLRAGRWV